MVFNDRYEADIDFFTKVTNNARTRIVACEIPIEEGEISGDLTSIYNFIQEVRGYVINSSKVNYMLSEIAIDMINNILRPFITKYFKTELGNSVSKEDFRKDLKNSVQDKVTDIILKMQDILIENYGSDLFNKK